MPNALAVTDGGAEPSNLDRLQKIGSETGAGFGNVGSVVSFKDALPIYLGTVTRGAMVLLGVIFFALMVYGGFLWLYAGGNDEQVTKAKSIIVRALIGFLIVIFAGGITQFILYYAYARR